MTRPIDEPWVCSRILSQAEIEQTTYYQKWAKPRSMIDSLLMVSARDPTSWGAFALRRHRDQGPITSDTVALAKLFLPHIQRAARISGLLEASVETAWRFETVIEALATPMFLVTADLAIVYANNAANALLETRRLLVGRDGYLTSDLPGIHRALLNLVSRSSENEDAAPGNGAGLPMRTDLDELHAVHLMPLARDGVRARLSQGAVAALFVSSAPVTHNLVSDVLVPLFDLTPAGHSWRRGRARPEILSMMLTMEAAPARDRAARTWR